MLSLAVFWSILGALGLIAFGAAARMYFIGHFQLDLDLASSHPSKNFSMPLIEAYTARTNRLVRRLGLWLALLLVVAVSAIVCRNTVSLAAPMLVGVALCACRSWRLSRLHRALEDEYDAHRERTKEEPAGQALAA